MATMTKTATVEIKSDMENSLDTEVLSKLLYLLSQVEWGIKGV